MNALKKPANNRCGGTLLSLWIESNSPAIANIIIDVTRAIAKKIILAAIGDPICLDTEIQQHIV
jgi:hypothetical protein